jgi:hypothetical protein
MPLPYQQNKKHIYNWRETHKENYLKQNIKDEKNIMKKIKIKLI